MHTLRAAGMAYTDKLTDISKDIHRYHVMQKLFLQYNTALPSSVPIG